MTLNVHYADLEKLASQHNLSATEILAWAESHPTFPEDYLTSHGLVNYATYLGIKTFWEARKTSGTNFAGLNQATADALIDAIAKFSGQDATAAAAVRGSTRTV